MVKLDPLLQYSSIVAISPIIAFALISVMPSSRPRLSEWISVVGVGISAALSLLILAIEFMSSGQGISPVAFQQQLPFLHFSAGVNVTLGIYVDWLTVVMIAVVSSLSLLIVVYSVGYMHAEGALCTISFESTIIRERISEAAATIAKNRISSVRLPLPVFVIAFHQ